MDIDAVLLNTKILIIDDLIDNVKLLEWALNKGGYRVLETLTDSRLALETYQRFQPDLVLLDLHMPFMDGFEVLDQLQQADKTGCLAVIILTANTDKNARLRALEAGAKDFITKPFDKAEVLFRIRNLATITLMNHQLLNQNTLLDEKVKERTQALEKRVVQHAQAELKIIHQAYHDPLTELPNRLWLSRDMPNVISAAREQDKQFAVIVFTLSQYQEINNTLGQDAGDHLLVKISQRLQAISLELPSLIDTWHLQGEKGRLVHLSGVTFTIICKINDINTGAKQVAQHLLQGMQQPFDYNGLSLDVVINIGIAHYPTHGENIDSLLRCANIALDTAIRNNDPMAAYCTEFDHFSQRRLTLMGELKKAIESNSLALHYQPQVALQSGAIIGAEALLRWQHPDLGFIPPDEFIPLAEQTGVIRPLTQWVLSNAIRQQHEFNKQGFDIVIAINLSAWNLREPGLQARILKLTDAYSVATSSIILEITESAMMQNPEHALTVLTELNAAGFKIAIDDFGTGYSSLAYLKRLPVHELKIDRTFVMNMTTDKDDATIVATTIYMSHNLGLKVIAEGVENLSTLEQLKGMNCNNIQGYYISKPIPAKDFLALLNKTTAPQIS